MGLWSSVSSTVTSVVSTAATIVDDVVPDVGDLVEDVCDRAGLPEWMGDVGSGIANFYTGNWVALATDAGDLLGDLQVVRQGGGEDAARLERSVNAGAQRLADTMDSIRTMHSRRPGPVFSAGEGSTSSAGSTGSTGGAGKTAMETALSFEKLSNEDFMAMIRNGDLPPEIARDPQAMMMVQQRMQEIQQMNALMTQVLRALHDMQTAVIQNIRS